jgi:hypothetical protein
MNSKQQIGIAVKTRQIQKTLGIEPKSGIDSQEIAQKTGEISLGCNEF